MADECCSKESCGCARVSQAAQSLDEMDFVRGIWYAAQSGDLDRVKQLVNSGKYQVDSRDSAGYTALHYAVRNGNFDVCSYLVENGADVNARTKAGGATPLHRACSAGQEEITEYLLNKKADPLLQDNDGKTALNRALTDKIRAIIKRTIEDDPRLQELAREKKK